MKNNFAFSNKHLPFLHARLLDLGTCRLILFIVFGICGQHPGNYISTCIYTQNHCTASLWIADRMDLVESIKQSSATL